MSTLSTTDAQIHYTDHGGSGRPVVLIHGWPLSEASWAPVVPALLDAGYRVITYDRRGFGASTCTPGSAYDYDVLTSDLAALLNELALADATLVGFSMGGGEVVRYVGSHGQSRLRSIVLAGAIPPHLLKDDDHPDGGLDMETVRSFQADLRAGRDEFFQSFLTNFYSVDGALVVTDDRLQASLAQAALADLDAAVTCIELWTADFTDDVAQIAVPTSIIHGDSDAIVPLEVSGRRAHEQIAGSELVVIADGPHGILDSHTERVRDSLLEFLQR